MAKQFNISKEDAIFIRKMILRAAIYFDRYGSDETIVFTRVCCDSLKFELLHYFGYMGPTPIFGDEFESIGNYIDKCLYYEELITKRPIPKIDKNLKDFCEKNLGDLCGREIKISEDKDGSLTISDTKEYFKILKSKKKSS